MNKEGKIIGKKDLRNTRILAVITIVSMLGVMAIRYLRSLRLSLTDGELFLQGTLPNFFAATGLYCVIFMWCKMYLVNIQRYTFRKTLWFVFWFTFTGLTVWEVVQLYIADAPIDLYDIGMSFIGCILISGLLHIMYRGDTK